jgi:hypothetical protein
MLLPLFLQVPEAVVALGVQGELNTQGSCLLGEGVFGGACCKLPPSPKSMTCFACGVCAEDGGPADNPTALKVTDLAQATPVATLDIEFLPGTPSVSTHPLPNSASQMCCGGSPGMWAHGSP